MLGGVNHRQGLRNFSQAARIGAAAQGPGATQHVTPPGRRPEPDGPDDGTSGSALGEIGRYAGHGITLGLSTALFAWVGDWLDGELGTEPVLVVAGAFLGFVAGFYSMYRDLVLHRPESDPDAGEER